MAYQSRRERRLRIEAERKRQIRQRVKDFLIVALALTIFAAITIYIGNQEIDSKIWPNILNKNKKTAKTTKKSGEKANEIQNNLTNQISNINSQLNIRNQSNLSGLPNNTATAVSVVDLSGKGRGTVSYNGSVQFTSASTYKIYVAYAMIHDVETKTRTWNSRLDRTTWDECLSRMIVNSDNSCPEAFISARGYDYLNNVVHSVGISSATRFAYDDMRTTSDDLAKMLTMIYQAKIVTKESRDKLFDLMSKQVYREGIPAGVGGIVYDKVGFLNQILNDAAVVKSDTGDYALVIMTNGESWLYIARVASYVNSVMRR